MICANECTAVEWRLVYGEENVIEAKIVKDGPNLQKDADAA